MLRIKNKFMVKFKGYGTTVVGLGRKKPLCPPTLQTNKPVCMPGMPGMPEIGMPAEHRLFFLFQLLYFRPSSERNVDFRNFGIKIGIPPKI